MVFSSTEPKTQVIMGYCPSVRRKLSHLRLILLIESKISTSTKFMFLDRSEKQNVRPGLWLAETFSTSLKPPLTGFNETWHEARSQRHLPSLCFSGRSEKTRSWPWPLIGWDIFDFSSETAERNSMKLDRKQDLNVFWQVFFRTNRKNKMAALTSDWLRLFRLNCNC